jgi:sialic acid synthase SpsE
MSQEEFRVGGRVFGAKNALIVAELGTGHGGDPVKARELCDAAGEAGADCIKFQIVYADEILHPNTGELSLPGGKIRLYDRFKELEVPPEFFASLKEYVESRGLIFLCTPFGPRSAAELKALNPVLVKIASPELNYTALLREIAQWGVPVLLSSGVSKLGDIEEALSLLRAASSVDSGRMADGGRVQGEGAPVCLLHCVTSYPAPETDYNLRVLGNLAGIFGVSVGLSDHSMDPELVPALGIAMGAAVVEKHFCLSRKDLGLDDPIALPPDDFSQMVRAIRQAQAADPKEIVAVMGEERGKSLVEAVLGDGVKRLAPSELANYERTNRSLHALRDIPRGTIIDPADFAVLRTEKILRPGLPPSWAERVSGRKAREFIPSGEGIRFEDLS